MFGAFKGNAISPPYVVLDVTKIFVCTRCHYKARDHIFLNKKLKIEE